MAQQATLWPGKTLAQFYAALAERFGPQGWWPARTRLEVIVGAILTQNTAWRNAALALQRLRQAGRLTWAGLRGASLADLEECIRPSGFSRRREKAGGGAAAFLEIPAKATP